MHLGRGIPVQDELLDGFTVGRVNPSNSAFYQSKARVDGSLDEPMTLHRRNAFFQKCDTPHPHLRYVTREWPLLHQVENVNRIHMLFEFFSSAFRSRGIQLLMKKIVPVFASFFCIQETSIL